MTIMPFSLRFRTMGGVAALLMTGCSAMQPTPIMPSYPAAVGGNTGVTAQADQYCRSQAYQAAERTKQSNTTKEVASTAIGAVAGAVIGNNLTYHDDPWHSHDMKGVGTVAGAATGAAVSQGMTQNTQQVYDITYNNCIQNYRSGTR